MVAAVTPVESTDAVTAAISTATMIVDLHLLESGYTVELLTRIETYLAGHYYRLNDRRAHSERADVVSETLEAPRFGMFFSGTAEGQSALMLDHKGTLAKLEGRMRQSIETKTPATKFLAAFVGGS
jgi:hypothetical protein